MYLNNLLGKLKQSTGPRIIIIAIKLAPLVIVGCRLGERARGRFLFGGRSMQAHEETMLQCRPLCESRIMDIVHSN